MDILLKRLYITFVIIIDLHSICFFFQVLFFKCMIISACFLFQMLYNDFCCIIIDWYI